MGVPNTRDFAAESQVVSLSSQKSTSLVLLFLCKALRAVHRNENAEQLEFHLVFFFV